MEIKFLLVLLCLSPACRKQKTTARVTYIEFEDSNEYFCSYRCCSYSSENPDDVRQVLDE